MNPPLSLRFLLLLCIVALPCMRAQADGITYQPADSVRVEQLLAEAALLPADANRVLFFANKLKGIPYVAHTLEVNEEEQLVVNLRQLDCTTFVETVMALSLASRHGQRAFTDFCFWLRRMRYRSGVLDGYGSRNHYFCQWVESNVALGIAEEVATEGSPFDGKQTLDIHYMTQHTDAYTMLRGNEERQRVVREAEQEMLGRTVRYIPTANLGLSQQRLSMVHDGDILAIVTSKDGLDTTHLGLAVWGNDGKLHLLNASSIHHKVVLEPMTLQQYMQKQAHRLGVRVIRLKG